MASKKTIAGVSVLAVLIISGAILIPMFIINSQKKQEEEQGFQLSGLFKEVTVIDMGLGMYSTSSISSSASYDPAVLFNSTTQQIVPIEFYALNRLGGPGMSSSELMTIYSYLYGGEQSAELTQTTAIMSAIQGMIDIQLSFNLTLPDEDNTTISYDGDIWGLLGGNFNFQIMLGEEDLQYLSGVFHLELYMEIYINLPTQLFGFDIPDIGDYNFTVGPLSMDFNVTQ
jgi:hypothetical protein